MWLATTFGFFSLNHLEDGTVAARSHVLGDLENLQTILDLDTEIERIAGSSEFAYQVILDVSEVGKLAQLAVTQPCDDIGPKIHDVPDQQNKSYAYQRFHSQLLDLQLQEQGDRLQPDEAARSQYELLIRKDLTSLVKQSLRVGVDDAFWDINRISWTGEEWEELKPCPGYCYVEAFEHSTPPLDYIYVISVRTGTPTYIACYEGDVDSYQLTTYRLECEILRLPDEVTRP